MPLRSISTTEQSRLWNQYHAEMLPPEDPLPPVEPCLEHDLRGFGDQFDDMWVRNLYEFPDRTRPSFDPADILADPKVNPDVHDNGDPSSRRRSSLTHSHTTGSNSRVTNDTPARQASRATEAGNPASSRPCLKQRYYTDSTTRRQRSAKKKNNEQPTDGQFKKKTGRRGRGRKSKGGPPTPALGLGADRAEASKNKA